MATPWADQQLALIRPQYAGRWEIWYLLCYPNDTTWHARSAGTEIATVHADSPEALVKAIAEQEAAAL